MLDLSFSPAGIAFCCLLGYRSGAIVFHMHYAPLQFHRAHLGMVHLLREASVERAIAFYGDTAAIPERNIAYLTALGSKTAEAQLQRCYNLP